GLRPDQEQVGVSSARAGAEVGARRSCPELGGVDDAGNGGQPGAAGAEKQVLHDEALTAAHSSDEGGQKEPEEFEHRGRIADARSRRNRRMVFCPPTTACGAHWRASCTHLACRRRLSSLGRDTLTPRCSSSTTSGNSRPRMQLLPKAWWQRS